MTSGEDVVPPPEGTRLSFGGGRFHVSRTGLICLSGLAAGGVLAIALRFATPSLLKSHPVLLETFYASVLAIVTGGAYARVGRASLAAVILAPLAVIAIYDVFAWWAGRLWGGHIIELYTMQRSRRFRRRVARAEGWIRRRGIVALSVAYFLPVPNFIVYLVCGSSGMPLWMFVLGDAIGTLIWTGLLVGLGWEAGHSAVTVVNTINHYALYVTLALIVISFVVATRRRPARERSFS